MNYQVQSRLWIANEGTTFLGNGRVQLLKAIMNTGSISKAARELGMSYKKAWKLIDSVNEGFKNPVVIRETGGTGGGGTTVTEEGEALIKMFEEFKVECEGYINKMFDQKMKSLKNLA